MTSSEFNVLESLLPDYINHINNLNNLNNNKPSSYNTQTKLTLFLGCYSYDTNGLFPFTYEKYYFFVMNNLIINRRDYILFDLKGSYINRTNNYCNYCYMRRCSNLLNEDYECDLKDNDYSERVAIKLKKDDEKNLLLYNILISDSSFLMQHSLMDYSLLLAVKKQKDDDKKISNACSDGVSNGNELVDINGTEFSILIIDLFQKWDIQKKIENIYKIVYIYLYLLFE